MRRIRLLIFIPVSIVAIIAVLITLGNVTSETVANGVINGNLTACPPKPNCISSAEEENNKSYFPPVPIEYEKWLQFKSQLATIRGAQIVSQTDNYVHIVFKTDFFRFRDDAEFFYRKNLNRMEIRSASRLGKSDLGTNRKRMTGILTQIIQR